MRRSSRQPTIEQMESRELMTVFQVTSGANAGPGTLRAAINMANQSPGVDTIQFDGFQHPDSVTISTTSPLPAITGRVVIDGYTAGGSARNTSTDQAVNNAKLGVRIVSTAGSSILTINPRGGGSQVRGVAFVNKGAVAVGVTINQANFVTLDGNAFQAEGQSRLVAAVRIVDGEHNTIGGDVAADPALQNVMSGYEVGVEMVGPSRHNAVVGNRIGGETYPSRAPLQVNGAWLRAAASNNTIVNNLFYKNRVAIRAESAGNVIDGNTIVPA